MSCVLSTFDVSNTCATWSGTISLHWRTWISNDNNTKSSPAHGYTSNSLLLHNFNAQMKLYVALCFFPRLQFNVSSIDTIRIINFLWLWLHCTCQILQLISWQFHEILLHLFYIIISFPLNVQLKQIKLGPSDVRVVHQNTNLVVASTHVLCDGTSLVGGCLDSHRPPSSHNSLTSHQSVSISGLAVRRQWLQHAPAPDCVCQQLPASYQPQSRVLCATNTSKLLS